MFRFWNKLVKKDQDYYLFGLIRKKETEETKDKQIRWNYYLKLQDMSEIKVCFDFFIKIFQIKKDRIYTIEGKLLQNKNLNDLRGRTRVIIPKINQELFNEFINLIPKVPSHYTPSQKFYFSNRDLNLTKLFEKYKLFLQGKSLDFKLSYTTFTNYFKNNCNIKFKHHRTDVCDFCYKMENTVENYKQDPSFINHHKNVESHKKLKNNFIKNEKYVVLEFDYAQNRTLPNAPNSELFYKRQLNLFIFNVHVYNIKSFIFNTVEGKSPKNTNSVCTSIFKVLQILNTENKLDEKELIFLSDNTCAQNKNFIMLKFCSYISIKFNIKITHLYPVRGHSFSICDTNFSHITKSTKTIETIELPEIYLKYYEKSTNFEVIKGKNYNYCEFLETYFFVKRNSIKIMKSVKIEYLPCGNILLYRDYNENYCDKINIVRISDDLDNFHIIKNSNIDNKFLVRNTGISIEKRKDIESIIDSISINNRKFYQDHLKKVDKNCDEFFF